MAAQVRNVELDVEDQTTKSRGKLVLIIDLDKDLGPSKSLQSTIIASTGGAVTLEEYGMPELRVNLNVFEVGKKPGKRKVHRRRGE